jgi:hypothetical protein
MPPVMTVLAIVVLMVGFGVAVSERRRRRARLDAELWPWMIDEIDAKVRGGQAPAAAVLGVALHGPAPLCAAATAAQRVWSSGGDAVAALTELQHGAADPRLDRLCETLAAVHAFDGDGAAVLARLRSDARHDARRDRELERQRSAVRCAAWLALAPVTAVVSGRLTAGPALLAIVAATCAWLGVAATRSRHVRVFGVRT